jgi:hypothetical protein
MVVVDNNFSVTIWKRCDRRHNECGSSTAIANHNLNSVENKKTC